MDQKTVGNNCKNYYEIIQKIRTKTLQLMNTPLQKKREKETIEKTTTMSQIEPYIVKAVFTDIFQKP